MAPASSRLLGAVLLPKCANATPFVNRAVLSAHLRRSSTPCHAYSVPTMPYARRDPLGQLLSLHRKAEPEAQEHLADDAPEVLTFLAHPSHEPSADRFSELDADFVRVLEDLVDTLVARNVINLTDLPLRARDKLYQRKGHRRETALSQLNLLGETSGPGYADIPMGYLPPN